MDAKRQKALRIEINDIVECYCVGCEFNVSRGKSRCRPKQRNKKGEIISYDMPCPVPLKLRELGKQILSRNKQVKNERKKTVSSIHLQYVAYFEKGYSNDEVKQLMKTSIRSVFAHRKRWFEQQHRKEEKQHEEE